MCGSRLHLLRHKLHAELLHDIQYVDLFSFLDDFSVFHPDDKMALLSIFFPVGGMPRYSSVKVPEVLILAMIMSFTE
ncbi:MAG: hypothetical protein PVH84_14445 [Candidatus Aminicenantes bacterium]